MGALLPTQLHVVQVSSAEPRITSSTPRASVRSVAKVDYIR